jgi:hypothetical protein
MPRLQSVHASELALDSMGAWHVQFEDLKRRMACRFSRYDAHAHACEYIKALLSPIERKNAWQIAEQAQVESPYRFQHLINRGKWEAELMRDDLFDYINDNLAEEGGIVGVRHRLHWSYWRRWHQTIAKHYHCLRRAMQHNLILQL